MNFALRMPDSLAGELKKLSKQDRVSINQFIVTAVAEKMASLKTADMIEQMSRNGSRNHALSMLSRVSDKKPLEYDKLDDNP